MLKIVAVQREHETQTWRVLGQDTTDRRMKTLT